MSDFQTERSAAQFWRDIDARIERKLLEERKRQTGIVPGTAYGSVMFDAAGRAVWGGAGGSSPFVFRYALTGGLTITASTETRLNFNSMEQDDNGLVTTGASWKFEPASDGWYAPTLDFRWFPSGGALTAGDNYRINLYRANILIGEIFRWEAEMATPSGALKHVILRIPWFYQASWDINFRIDNRMSRSMVFSSTPSLTMERIGDPSP